MTMIGQAERITQQPKQLIAMVAAANLLPGEKPEGDYHA